MGLDREQLRPDFPHRCVARSRIRTLVCHRRFHTCSLCGHVDCCTQTHSYTVQWQPFHKHPCEPVFSGSTGKVLNKPKWLWDLSFGFTALTSSVEWSGIRWWCVQFILLLERYLCGFANQATVKSPNNYKASLYDRRDMTGQRSSEMEISLTEFKVVQVGHAAVCCNKRFFWYV